MAAATGSKQQTFRAWNPGEAVPAGHPFAQRHAGTQAGATAQVLHPRHVPLPVRRGAARRASRGLHRHGHSGPLPPRARLQCPAPDWLGRLRPARRAIRHQDRPASAQDHRAEHRDLQAPDQVARASATTGAAKSTPPTRSISSGRSGSSSSSTTRGSTPQTNKAEPIETLPYPPELQSKAPAWPAGSPGVPPTELEAKRRAYRDSKRLAYVTEAPVWWCEQLGTVLANEEVVDGKSEVGGFPVVRKPMRQWMLRITAYAERLAPGPRHH